MLNYALQFCRNKSQLRGRPLYLRVDRHAWKSDRRHTGDATVHSPVIFASFTNFPQLWNSLLV